MEILRQLKTAFLLLLFFTILTGLIYPGIVTAVAQLLFPWKANGSLIMDDGKIAGSVLIGQSFEDPRYFWGRPSATIPTPYNALSSSGSNLGPSNPALLDAIKNRVIHLRRSDPQNMRLIPVELVTASASGLDPDISPLAAFYQVSRIAAARGLPEKKIHALVEKSINHRFLFLLGEPRVNVLQLNRALDRLSP